MESLKKSYAVLVGDLPARAARRAPAKTAVIFGATRLSFAQVEVRVRRCMAFLAAQGLRHVRAEANRLKHRGTTICCDQMPVQPPIEDRLMRQYAAFHQRLRAEMREVAMQPAHGVYDRQFAGIEQGFERRRGRIQREEPVQIQRRTCGRSRLRQADRRAQTPVVRISVRHDGIQPIYAAALEHANQNVPICVSGTEGQPRRQRGGAAAEQRELAEVASVQAHGCSYRYWK